MSERSTEKQLSRSERPVVTPQPSRPAFFEWVEDKFKGRESRPRFFELRVAYGPQSAHYRPEVLHQKEFKPNVKEPERDEMVELSNKFMSIAQENCNEVGRPTKYVVHAINHMKSAAPYGGYLMALRPMMGVHDGGGADGSGSANEEDILSDGMHKNNLLVHSLDHMKASDEHARFMQDGLQKSTGSIISVLMATNTELRAENAALKGMQLEYFKAIQEAHNTQQDREMKQATHNMKMAVAERGVGLLLQMIPVVAKTLEGRKNGAASLPASDTITASPESIAIEQFIHGMSNEQKIALFGHFTPEPDQKHVPGILTASQVKLFADVAELRVPPTVLELLLPEGALALTGEQLAAAQTVVSMDQLMPLYAMIREGQNNRIPREQQS